MTSATQRVGKAILREVEERLLDLKKREIIKKVPKLMKCISRCYRIEAKRRMCLDPLIAEAFQLPDVHIGRIPLCPGKGQGILHP